MYSPNGIFIDEANTDESAIDYYAELVEYLTSLLDKTIPTILDFGINISSN